MQRLDILVRRETDAAAKRPKLAYSPAYTNLELLRSVYRAQSELRDTNIMLANSRMKHMVAERRAAALEAELAAERGSRSA